MAIVDELVAVLGYKLQGQGNLKKFQDGLDQTQKKAASAGRAIAAAAAAVTGALGALGLGALAKSVIDTSAKFETFQATLETIEGSADKARKSLAWITEFAAKTPYEVSELTAAFVKLKSYGLDPTDGTMAAIGDTASAMGKSLDSAVEAFADAATGEFERLKEFGMRASKEGKNVTFTWTENGKEFRKTVKENSKEILSFLNTTMGKRFAGGMDKQSRTWRGMMSNISDSWEAFKRAIGDAGFFEEVRIALDRVRVALVQWEKSGGMKRAAKAISDFLSSIVKGIQRAADLVRDWYNSNASTIEKFWRDFQKRAEGLNWVQTATLIMRTLADALTSKSGILFNFWEAFRKELGADGGWRELGTTIGKAIADGFIGAADYLEDRLLSMFPSWVRDYIKSIGGGTAVRPNSVIGQALGMPQAAGSRQWSGVFGENQGIRGRLNRQGRPGAPVTGGRPSDAGLAGGTGSAQGSSRQTAMRAAMEELRRQGVPEANLRAAAAHLVGQADMESGLNPNAVHDGGTGYGIYGARLDRRARMLNWLQENGYARNSLDGQTRYMAREAMTDPDYRPTRNVLMNANPSSFAGDTNTITRNFERPAVINARSGAVGNAYRSLGTGSARPAFGPADNFDRNLDRMRSIQGGASLGQRSSTSNSNVTVGDVTVMVPPGVNPTKAVGSAIRTAVATGAAPRPARMQASPVA